MAIYAIGDVQGCYRELRDLLDVVRFDPGADQLWLVGDLVNRGPGSLDVLRFVRSLGSAAKVVLGNHDLYLLRVAYGNAGKRKRNDTLQELIDAPDAPRLLDWLRRRPLMHVEGAFAMVHAGLLPCWTVEQARALAAEVEAVLAGERFKDLLVNMWGNTPLEWSDELTGWARLRVIINALTRMRFVSLTGEIEFDAKGPPDKAPPEHIAWFGHPARASADTTIVCGHWSALNLSTANNLIALDTGCVWGNRLTAVRLNDRHVFQVRARAAY